MSPYREPRPDGRLRRLVEHEHERGDAQQHRPVHADIGRRHRVYGAGMPIRLHRCSKTWLHLSIEPCWKVQRELDRQGIEYEIVAHPNARWNRDAIEQLSGQKLLPVIEFEDGTIYREDSTDMAALIAAGRLRERDTGA